ncbi:MAG: aromatic amino acid lyase [Verrucomicrobiales bacterium]|nr:aromatic amino acid lyase [Verrucomicrobiales bacterium]
MQPLELDGHHLVIGDLWLAATTAVSCRLSAGSVVRMRESRALVERVAAEPRAVYGINTGFGPLSGTRVPMEDLRQHQLNLLHHLSVGQGALFSEAETRAILVARANALARGFSGIRPEVVERLLGALNAGVLPEIPCEGSVGASGDLAPLAHMARMLVGLGHVRTSQGREAAAAALARHGLELVTLECKEGLALVNGTSVMAALAGLATYEAAVLLSWMEFLTACLFQALGSSPEVLCEQVHWARGFRGQSLVAHRIAGHLRTHPRYRQEIDEHHWGSDAKPVDPGLEIQDPYSVRCAPQILGAFQEALWHIEEVVNRELNASTDNPLAFPKTESIIHCGNFYGQQIAMACDYLRIGLAKCALLVERQLERLVNWRYSAGLPPLLTGADPGLNSGFMGVQLLATSLAAECRLLSAPASVQTIPTNANNQDVVSMGTISARMTRDLVAKTWKLVAIQSLALAQAADLRPEDFCGSRYAEFRRRIRGHSARLTVDRPLFEDLARVRDWLSSPEAGLDLLTARPPRP